MGDYATYADSRVDEFSNDVAEGAMWEDAGDYGYADGDDDGYDADEGDEWGDSHGSFALQSPGAKAAPSQAPAQHSSTWRPKAVPRSIPPQSVAQDTALRP